MSPGFSVWISLIGYKKAVVDSDAPSVNMRETIDPVREEVNLLSLPTKIQRWKLDQDQEGVPDGDEGDKEKDVIPTFVKQLKM